MTRILWMQFGVVGDALLSTVALRSLRRMQPDAHITWCIFADFREIACKCPLVDDVVAWPLRPNQTRQAQELQAWREMKAWAHQTVVAGKADRILIPQIYPDHPWEQVPRLFCLADHQCRNAGVPIATFWRDREIAFQPTERDVENLEGRIRGWDNYSAAFNAGIVPCNARSQTQPAVWRDEQYIELSDLLSKDNLELVLGDCDIGSIPRFDGSLGEWVALIDRATVHVGLDSGGSWAAAATDAFQIVMYPETPIVPRWLSGMAAMNVKDAEEFVELTAPTVKQVRDAIYDQLYMQVIASKEGKPCKDK